jgi:hypothetical protein
MTIHSIDDKILGYGVWGDDDSDYRVLRNAMVVVRKGHTCDLCFGSIPVGARVRAQTEVCDGACKTFRFCPDCCSAMAIRHDDDGETIEARYELGRRNALSLQVAPA